MGREAHFRTPKNTASSCKLSRRRSRRCRRATGPSDSPEARLCELAHPRAQIQSAELERLLQRGPRELDRPLALAGVPTHPYFGLGDEHVAAAAHRLDDALTSAVVADGTPSL